MPICSILLFIIAGAFLCYAGITYLTKKIAVPVTRYATVQHVTPEYARQFAKLMAFLSIAPIVGGVSGLFLRSATIPVILFVVLFVVLLIVGIRIFVNQPNP